MKKYIISLIMLVVCSINSAMADDNWPPGCIQNTSNGNIIIWRDFPTGPPMYKILGPNCATPVGEDWDYATQVNNPNIWYKAGLESLFHLEYTHNYQFLCPSVVGVQTLATSYPPTGPIWTPSWNPTNSVFTPVPTQIYPIHNATIINPAGPSQPSPFVPVYVTPPLIPTP